VIRFLYFGLPLGAVLLARDGLLPALAVLSPTEAPGRRRLRRLLGDRVVDARGARPAALERRIRAWFDREPPDLVVSWFWTRRLPPRFVEEPRLGAIGVHPSLLPRHRGPDPFFHAIDSGDRVTGVTLHRLERDYDTGAILAREELAIGDRDSWQLARALDRPSLRLLRAGVRDAADGRLGAGEPQDARAATEGGPPSGAELCVDFRGPTERVLRRCRALTPAPGLALELRGVPLVVTRVAPTAEVPRAVEPGEAAVSASGVVIRTADGAVRILRGVVADAAAEERELDGVALARYLGVAD